MFNSEGMGITVSYPCKSNYIKRINMHKALRGQTSIDLRRPKSFSAILPSLNSIYDF